MKLIIITALLGLSACAPTAVAGIGIVTGVALTTNIPAVEKAGDKYLSNKEGE